MQLLKKLVSLFKSNNTRASAHTIQAWTGFDANETEALHTLAAHLAASEDFVSCAESCTGGYLSYIITSVPELSKQFNGSIVSYSPDVKRHVLGVSNKAVQQQQAVNEQCAREMLMAVLEKFDSDYAIAITGFAGPDGGTDKEPVGAVYIAVGTELAVTTRRYVFTNNRQKNIKLFAIAALQQLNRFIEQQQTN